MKKTAQLKSLVMAMAVAGSTVAALAPATSQAGASANIGAVTKYYFRGLAQTDSAAAQGGLDYDFGDSGFSVGTWESSLSNGGTNQGLEYDLYGGWSGSFSGLDVGVNLTRYGYTKDFKKDANAFDSSYLEASASLGYKFLSLDVATGSHEGASHKTSGSDYKDQTYMTYALTATYAGISATYGVGDKFLGTTDGNGSQNHNWIDVSYSTEIAKGTDVSISYISMHKDKNNYGASKGSDESMIVGITKSFDL
ncbi:TorF family putative porin [Hydrogenovibrio sp. JE_KL2]|uniref:TorF family putative porin n=1 Tax=Hydrogenovibrio sp. JE_KL2 TaxID=2651188 RepID=UPI00128D1E0A|nr:TorF family putative porin [Hydrogenovibrio sp. JE_KL2]MPQ76775.1 hypothetical protein [Hydrogenovibrio sp. JE_KL2]